MTAVTKMIEFIKNSKIGSDLRLNGHMVRTSISITNSGDWSGKDHLLELNLKRDKGWHHQIQMGGLL